MLRWLDPLLGPLMLDEITLDVIDGVKRSISVEQAETLLGELPAHQRDVVLFALATGLRQSNVVGLEWSHVDLETGHAWVSAGQSKNRRPIAVPLTRPRWRFCGDSSGNIRYEYLRMQRSRLGVPILA